MAFQIRSARQLNALSRNRLETSGSDLTGDGIAAARAYHLTAPTFLSGQIAKDAALTGGELAAVTSGTPRASLNGVYGASAIAIIAYNTGQSDGSGNPPTVDALRFVALENLAAGTVIYFSDRS